MACSAVSSRFLMRLSISVTYNLFASLLTMFSMALLTAATYAPFHAGYLAHLLQRDALALGDLLMGQSHAEPPEDALSDLPPLGLFPHVFHDLAHGSHSLLVFLEIADLVGQLLVVHVVGFVQKKSCISLPSAVEASLSAPFT